MTIWRLTVGRLLAGRLLAGRLLAGWLLAGWLLVSGGLVGCDGNAGTDNQPPTANAGSDRSVDANTQVTLSGSGTDTDGIISSYRWTQVSGAVVAVTDATSAGPSFFAPEVSDDETLTFELTVTDDDGATDSDRVDITVGPASGDPRRYSFGVHPSSANGYTFAKDLGVDFNREGVYVIWGWVDVDKNGAFKFKDATAPAVPGLPGSGGQINYDEERLGLLDVDGIALMNNVCPFHRGDIAGAGFQDDAEKVIYSEFVEKLVARYDGDADLGCTQTNGVDCYRPGDGEYPEQALIDLLEANPIKYWQVCNQVTDTCDGPDCAIDSLYAEKYAEVLQLTYVAVKSVCPDCQVAIGGDSAKELYPPVYDVLAGSYIDIVDMHFFGEASEYVRIDEEMSFLRDALQSAGFDLDTLRFWITETGTYAGDPVDDLAEPPAPGQPFQSETQQAQGLVKIFATAFGAGTEKVLWAWGIKEGFGCDCCLFDYTGLVYDGNVPPQSCDENLYDRGDNVKKLAYYSYKLMTQKLAGFASVETVQGVSGTYVYRFVKGGSPVYVAWSETGAAVTLSGLSTSSVKITESTPMHEYGEQVTDFDAAFYVETRSVDSGSVSISLSETPVFVEMQ